MGAGSGVEVGVRGSRLREKTSPHKLVYNAGKKTSHGTLAGCWRGSQAKSSRLRPAKMQSPARRRPGTTLNRNPSEAGRSWTQHYEAFRTKGRPTCKLLCPSPESLLSGLLMTPLLLIISISPPNIFKFQAAFASKPLEMRCLLRERASGQASPRLGKV